jgi:NAD(P)-dependent dehydrogenase (short-subunit alcohol dehydrogenase family)
VSGRAVLVTGGSRGIGTAIARAFAEDGDRVAVHYGTSRAAAMDVVAGLPGAGHVAVQADLADPEAVRQMVDEAAERLGGLDVLVNNAGVYLDNQIDEDDYERWQEAWRRTLDVNLLGPANVTWCAVRHLRERGGGRIVNVSSRGAFRGEPMHLAYGASKGALNSFTQSLAKGLGRHGIVVTGIAPGFVATDMANAILDGPRHDEILAQSPFGRVATVDEVAKAVVFLAAPDIEFTSGAILDLNGASHLRI